MDSTLPPAADDGSAATGTSPTTRHEAPAGHSWPRRLARWAALASLAAVLIPVAARLFSWEAGPLAYVVSLLPWVTLATLVPLLLAIIARSRVIVGASLVVLVACIAWLGPLFVAADAPPASSARLRVATANLTLGRADADAVVAMVRDREVDVLAVQELTPREVDELRAAGLDDVMPFSELRPQRGVEGTGVWSRIALDDVRDIHGLTSRAVRAQITVAGETIAFFVVHPWAPGMRDHRQWSADMDALTALLDRETGAVLVAGDFNTARDHRSFRELQRLGFVDAADQAGAGFLPTFPEGSLPMPLVAIDHVIARDAPLVAVDVATVTIAGADHRALVVTYAAE